MRGGCETAWKALSTDLLKAAVDPLFQLERYGFGGRDVAFRPISDAFPEELKILLERSLPLAAELTSIDPSGFPSPQERVDFMIDMLATVGDDVSLAVLESLCDSPVHGRAAVGAVKAIQARILAARRFLAPPKRT